MRYLGFLLLLLVLGGIPAWGLTPSGPITINTSGTVISGLRIQGSGTCVTIASGVNNVTIKESDIGPCTGQGILITNSSGHHIYDNYIHVESAPSGCCDTRDGIKMTNVSTVDIQGNVIGYSEVNIRVESGSSGVTVHGNYLFNPLGPYPRGQNFQDDQGSNMTVTNNFTYACELAGAGLGGVTCPSSPAYLLSAFQQDSINFYGTQGGLAQNNYIWGGTSTAGTAIIADGSCSGAIKANNIQIRNNKAYNSAHVGFSAVEGGGHIIDGNKVANSCLGGWDCTNDTAISVFDCPGTGCGPVTVSNNIAYQTRPANNSQHAGYYGGSGTGPGGTCSLGGGTTLSGNTFDAAAKAILDPMLTTNPPPLIPPVPKNCTAVSPYTTQTTPALCGAALTAAPTVTITTNCGGGVGGNCTVTTTPLTPILQGTATDDVTIPVGGITWSCPTCSPASGTASCTGCAPSGGTSVTWSVATLGLAVGPNVITVTATDGDPQSVTDTITVTLLATTLRIDTGAATGATFSDGPYQADAFFNGGTTATTGTPIAGTTDQALYQSERYLNLGAGATMQYDLPLANGTYTITLKFAEQFWTAVGQRVFHVDLNGVRVLSNFDLFAQVGTNFTAIDRTFTTTVTGNTLPILFTNVVDHAEIVGMVAVPTTVTLAPPLLRLVK